VAGALVLAITLAPLTGGPLAGPALAAGNIVVNTTGDGACAPGVVSLRCAITLANSAGGVPVITFDIPSGQCDSKGVCTIMRASPLPTLTANYAAIEGESQPGAHANTNTTLAAGDNARLLIRLDGAGSGGIGLYVQGSGVAISGLSITDFETGIELDESAGSSGGRVQDTFLGLAPDGSAHGNTGDGLFVDNGDSVTIGGTTLSQANVISGNGAAGIRNGSGQYSVIARNYVGTDPTGTVPRGNMRGIFLENASSDQVTSNVVAGNSLVGVDVQGSADTTISGNYIGVSPSVLSTATNLGNLADGVIIEPLVFNASQSLASSDNLITNNSIYNNGNSPTPSTGAAGVLIKFGNSNHVVGNTLIGNQVGVEALHGAVGSVESNTILGSVTDAVLIGNTNADPVHFLIKQNRMSNNHGGIVLTGQSPCSAGPTNGAPDDYAPCPHIQAALTSGNVAGAACPNCLVELYLAAFDGEGQRYLGTVTADSAGAWNTTLTDLPSCVAAQSCTFSMTALADMPVHGLPPGSYETSEFAPAVPIQPLMVTTTADRATCPAGSGQPGYSLRCAIAQADAFATHAKIAFKIPPTDPGCEATSIHGTSVPVCTITPTGPLPSLSASFVTLDGYSQPGAAANPDPAKAALAVQLDGRRAGPGADGLDVTGGHDTISGLAIGRFFGNGLALFGHEATGDTVTGNLLGLPPSGGRAANFRAGLFWRDGATGNAGGNLSEDNLGAGIQVGSSGADTATHVALSHNLIFRDLSRGIVLAGQPVAGCASGPGGSGPNDDTPCPVIERATLSQIRGTACRGCTVEVFTTGEPRDPSGHGQAETFLGSATANGSGTWLLSAPYAAPLGSGAQWVTATATTAASPGPAETSAFAANVRIGGCAAPIRELAPC